MIGILDEKTVSESKRDLLIDFESYYDEAEELQEYIQEATARLSDSEWLITKDAAALDRLTKGRANWALDLLTLSYSAGAEISELREFYPDVLVYFEEFALHLEAFNRTEEGKRLQSPCFYLLDVDFERANRLLSFAILLGWQKYLPRVMAIIDYNNPAKDALLERLAGHYISRPAPAPDDCLRHLPYYGLLAAFSAAQDLRPQIVHEYLEGWYRASRRESYFDSHNRGVPFLGYWAWEAAAITVALGIDDRSYRDLQFYPRDLAAYGIESGSPAAGTVALMAEIRAKAGEPCPASGTWESIGIPVQRAQYVQGTPMPDLGSPYGLTVWRRIDA